MAHAAIGLGLAYILAASASALIKVISTGLSQDSRENERHSSVGIEPAKVRIHYKNFHESAEENRLRYYRYYRYEARQLREAKWSSEPVEERIHYKNLLYGSGSAEENILRYKANRELREAKESGDSKVECLSDMAQVYPVVWHGNLVMKNARFPTRMHLIGGDPAIAKLFGSDSLHITQKILLARVEKVNKRMITTVFLALPGNPMQEVDEGKVSTHPLKSLVRNFEQEGSAGIVVLKEMCAGIGNRAQREILYVLPPCEFSQSQLQKIAPNLGKEPAQEDYVVVILVMEK